MQNNKQAKPKGNRRRKIDILTYLERKDKWYLGGDNKLLWAPPFPVWLDYPGFWDKAHYYNREIEPLFTWTILDDEGKEVPLRSNERTWNPSKLIQRYEVRNVRNKLNSMITIEETKCCLPDSILTSVVKLTNKSKKTINLHFIAWTIQPNYPSKKTTWVENVKVKNTSIEFIKHLQPQHPSAPIMPVRCGLSFDQRLISYSVNLSEGSVIQPHWKLTPFIEKFKTGKLPNEVKLSGVTNDGLLYIAIHSAIELEPQTSEVVSVYFSVAGTEAEIKKNNVSITKQKNPVKISEGKWNECFSGLPYFQCSDEYITKYYWYRWYGLRLNTMPGDEGNYLFPCVCEGIGYFHAPISYSAMCHMVENRWLHNPRLAQGSLMTFIANQHTDGRFRGYIDVDFYRQEKLGDEIVEPFYHANWGKSLLELHYIHPDKKFLKQAYDGLVKYVEYFDRERDVEGSGLYDIDNHYETGQEYMHRYMAVDLNADKDNWGEVFRLKGVDVTVYMYELKKSLTQVAEILGDTNRCERWRNGAETIKHAIKEKMWDSQENMFFDIDPRTGLQTKVKATTCFYPYMTDIVDESHLSGLKKHLLSKNEFWTQYPVPSSSVDDIYFNTDAEWKGKRMNCPWNGRVWPMTNSHIVEALAQTAIRFNDKELKEKTVELISKYIRMMFYSDDPSLPNCFEHYNPQTGNPSMYRGVDDYQHSWVVDLIIKYVCGIRPMQKNLIVDPFPFEISSFRIDDVKIRGKNISVERKEGLFSVYISGKKVCSSKIGEQIIFKDF